VERFVTEVIKCLGVRAPVRTVVAPAVGSPGGVWKFSGKAEDFESAVLYEPGSMVLNREYDEIVLDLTHGINFMPALTLRIAYRLASILLVAYGELGKRGIRILVYNSDPHRYDREESKRFPVNINLIAREALQGVRRARLVVRGEVRELELPDDLVKDVERVVESLRRVLESERPLERVQSRRGALVAGIGGSARTTSATSPRLSSNPANLVLEASDPLAKVQYHHSELAS
jgi:CRISPR-associated protein Csx1